MMQQAPSMAQSAAYTFVTTISTSTPRSALSCATWPAEHTSIPAYIPERHSCRACIPECVPLGVTDLAADVVKWHAIHMIIYPVPSPCAFEYPVDGKHTMKHMCAYKPRWVHTRMGPEISHRHMGPALTSGPAVCRVKTMVSAWAWCTGLTRNIGSTHRLQ